MRQTVIRHNGTHQITDETKIPKTRGDPRRRFASFGQCGSHRPSRSLRLIPPHFGTRGPRLVRLANIAEGQHSGNQGISYKSDVVITERFLLAKRGAASDSIDICGAANVPIGLITDEAAAVNDYVNVAHFNSD